MRDEVREGTGSKGTGNVGFREGEDRERVGEERAISREKA